MMMKKMRICCCSWDPLSCSWLGGWFSFNSTQSDYFHKLFPQNFPLLVFSSSKNFFSLLVTWFWRHKTPLILLTKGGGGKVVEEVNVDPLSFQTKTTNQPTDLRALQWELRTAFTSKEFPPFFSTPHIPIPSSALKATVGKLDCKADDVKVWRWSLFSDAIKITLDGAVGKGRQQVGQV